MVGGGNPIPLGWIHCPNAGTVMASRFVAFKTPLSSKYEGHIQKDKHWNPGSVFKYLEDSKINMGLWIDLTNTERYFNKAEVEKQGVKYVKLKIGGGGEVPSGIHVGMFIAHCKHFFDKNPDGVIGVHCTHGFNRTGFLICSFLTQVAKQNISDAFSEFCKARPPGIYRQGYVASLWKNYSVSGLPPVPKVFEPSWSQRRANHDRGTKRPAPDSSNWRTRPRVPEFFGDVPGIAFVEDQWLRSNVLNDVRTMCQEYMDIAIHPSYYEEFPGRCGRELRPENVSQFNSEYVATWIGEGSVKYLLLIKAYAQVFFVDSACNVFQAVHIHIPFTFPDRRDVTQMHLTDTLLDGEVTMEKFEGKLLPRFNVQDIICFNQRPIGHLPFNTRLSLLKSEVLEPRNACFKSGFLKRRSESTLGLIEQRFWPIAEAEQILNKFKNVTIAGLRLIPKNENYKPQCYGSSFDWRRSRNVNFRIEVNRREGRVDLYVLEVVSPFATITSIAELEQYDGKIGQFSYNGVTQTWNFVEEMQTRVPGSCADAVTAMRDGEFASEDELIAAIRRINQHRGQSSGTSAMTRRERRRQKQN